ncbi:berberine bridge enzyme-like Cyn d 4 [Phragmites australis]|uniref:berberine bridge enzyme-like Cyn d 4 n=1 Tax=Phragmites australis TaxID=29695 RepID=UPI002D76E718|nr:berberine bridge enzyme-like Cyn d 4 [Phragmites australis]
MAAFTKMARVHVILCFLCCNVFIASFASSDEFFQCLSETIPSEFVYPQTSSSFMSVLQSSVQNPKFLTNTTVRPLCIVTASDVSHVQATVRCGRRHGVRLRVRSGGHDYEGLSYRSVLPEAFAVLDLARLRAVRVHQGDATAWVDAGATLGELYYAIGTVNPGFAFPGGACPTVGISGFLSGGGIGLMMRKFGIGADNVIDAKIVNADGDVLNRAAMGKDLFWAIRGGGGESFGVIVEWQLKLSMVSRTVTVVNIAKTIDEGAAGIIAKWETLILEPFLPELTTRVVVQGSRAFFQTLFLGRCSGLVYTMRIFFPELNMKAADCHEMSWLRAMAFIGLGTANAPVEGILNRTTNLGTYVKNKSDYVRRAIGKAGWESIFQQQLSRNSAGLMILEPHGGVVGSVIPDTMTPYPHRQGVLYNIQYVVFWWGEANGTAAAAATGWLNGLYGFMERFVTSNPREAFANYRDLDIGQNVVGSDGVTTYESGRVWGEKYFMGNFRRLAVAKGKVDPGDYFRNEQSIPPLLQTF